MKGCVFVAYLKRDDLMAKLEVLEKQILELVDQNIKLKNRIIELEGQNSVQKIKNERNAGRKRKLSNEEIAIIDKLHLQGKSIRFIAKEMGCSVGLVHKIINEPIEGR